MDRTLELLSVPTGRCMEAVLVRWTPWLAMQLSELKLEGSQQEWL